MSNKPALADTEDVCVRAFGDQAIADENCLKRSLVYCFLAGKHVAQQGQ